MEELKKAEISEVINFKEGYDAPILAEFQNGHFTNTDNMCAKRVFDIETKRKHILVADGDSGTVYRSPIGEGQGNSLTNSYIAIHNKKTNKIRFVQIEEASLKSTHYDEVDMYSKPVIPLDKNTMLREFGGKNATRYLDRVNRMKPNVDIVADTLQDTLDNVDDSIFENDLLGLNPDEKEKLKNSIFPVVNKNATCVSQMYSLSSLIPSELLDHLDGVAIEILKTDLDSVPFVNDYLKQVVKAVQLSKEPDSRENLNRVKICLYADGLIRLINVRNPMLDKLELSKIAERIEIDIKDRFAQAGTKNRLVRHFLMILCTYFYVVLEFQINLLSLLN